MSWTMRVKFEVRRFNRLELLAFNAQRFRSHVTLTTPLLMLRDHVRTVPGNILVKFRFLALTVLELLLTGPLRIDTHTHTHRKIEQLENVPWISIPLQISNPIPWRHLASDV